MDLQRLLLLCPFLIMITILIFIIPFHNCFQDDPLLNYNDYIQEEDGGNNYSQLSYNPTTCSNYFSPIDQGVNANLMEDAVELMRLGDGLSTLKMFNASPTARVKTISVDDFGAKGNDGADDTDAFEKAWKEACSYAGGAILVVPPSNNYRLRPITFSGPCKSNIILQVYGTIEASDDRSDYEEDSRYWIMFDGVQNLVVGGGGTLDGNGKIWWQNSCKVNKALPCKDAPTALTFYGCKNLIVKKLKIQNAQQMHLTFKDSKNVQVSSITIASPEKSPNTDGIHVSNTQNIQITNSVIGTGDDCISIVAGSQNVQATGITCGPGHGISIGSLGAKNSGEYVSGITIDGAKFSGTTNGVRIKTWQGGSGSATNIKFQNIEMHNVANPIIIDQNYCDQKKPCKEQKSAVQVANVVYKNLKGTSTSDVAVKFDCSKTFPCQGILLQNVVLAREGGGKPKALCNNVHLVDTGVVSPRCP